MPAGPPDKYLTHVQPRLETIRAWKRDGLTEAQICENLGICAQTFSTYKKNHYQLLDVLKIGFDDAVAQVENAMMKRALGYTYFETTTTSYYNEFGKKVTEVKHVKKKMAPDVGAQIFILKNRRVDKWRDVYGHGEKGDTGTLDELINALNAGRANNGKPNVE